MKSLALALVFACAASAVAADGAQRARDAAKVLETAKAAKAKRKKSTARVITNADVKKSKGSVVVTNQAQAPLEGPAEESLVDKQESMRSERATYDTRYAAAKATVDALQKELAALEQQYYEENDLDRRDREIVRRFEETKKKLALATTELEGVLSASPGS
ncbi:MAG TPA: hypothetical protein VE010_15480 [Thermoanaerobaculia bacterium]|nr:hypothetical protein [Thermoanaerobaculia bacterium]